MRHDVEYFTLCLIDLLVVSFMTFIALTSYETLISALPIVVMYHILSLTDDLLWEKTLSPTPWGLLGRPGALVSRVQIHTNIPPILG